MFRSRSAREQPVAWLPAPTQIFRRRTRAHPVRSIPRRMRQLAQDRVRFHPLQLAAGKGVEILMKPISLLPRRRRAGPADKGRRRSRLADKAQLAVRRLLEEAPSLALPA